MDHLHISILIDYVRDLLPADRKTSAEVHLQACPQCAGELRQLKAVEAISSADVEYTPPEGLVKFAMEMFHAQEPARSEPVLMHLVFDSFAQLAPGGLRAGEMERNLSFENGVWKVDLNVDRIYGGAEITVVGQVLDSSGGHAGTSVRARAGKRMLTQTLSNERGEFSLSFLVRRGSILEIEPSGGSPLLAIPVRHFID